MSDALLANQNDQISRLNAENARWRQKYKALQGELVKAKSAMESAVAEKARIDAEADQLAETLAEYQVVLGDTPDIPALAEALRGATIGDVLDGYAEATTRLARIDAEPSVLQARIAELERSARVATHRSKFDDVARSLGFRDDALDDLRMLAKYEPESDEFDEDNVKDLLAPWTGKSYLMTPTESGTPERKGKAGGADKPQTDGLDARTAPGGAKTQADGMAAKNAARMPVVERGRPESASRVQTLEDRVNAQWAAETGDKDAFTL